MTRTIEVTPNSIISGVFSGLSVTILVLIVQGKEQFAPLWFFMVTGGLAAICFVYSASSYDDEDFSNWMLLIGFFPFVALLIGVIFMADFWSGVFVGAIGAFFLFVMIARSY